MVGAAAVDGAADAWADSQRRSSGDVRRPRRRRGEVRCQRALGALSGDRHGSSSFVGRGGRGGRTRLRTASTPISRVARTRDIPRDQLTRRAGRRADAAAAQAVGVGCGARERRRFLPPLSATAIVRGEELWRERPRFRAADLTRLASWGRSRHSSRRPCPWNGSASGSGVVTKQNAAWIACRICG